ncbi:PREDICTED: transmembrane protein 17-like isoform X2 [Amphimedon queenslandica]|uniref:Transmembrane protein 17 n=1 Tax=Amphimedon queenslandica TaxID=400682 RepID=A0AAN0JJV9_AMPQE|nr:PREDICTED: transmembrane protein 17-like isoform X2 [Amphimedon queenslandica]|eukprot:XP_019856968.1 PREDICTED: transmembrane protein 17-like isoform X2 [Amphimedon queenslandica]
MILPEEKAKQKSVEVVSHLLLQMTLHFNIYYSFPWMLSLIIGLELKFSFLLSHYKYVTVAVYVILFTVEMLRLYLGYEGNLREKVAELAGFWLLTVLQLLLVLYLVVNVNTVLLPLEFAVNGPLLFFLFVQIVTGFRSLQLMIQAQKVKYHISLLKFGQSLQNIEKLDQFDLN